MGDYDHARTSGMDNPAQNPSYITHNGQTYYQGPALGSSPSQHGYGKDDPPAYQHPAEGTSSRGAGMRGGYVHGSEYAGDPNANAYAYRNGYRHDGADVVVVRERSRAGPVAAGAAAGCCLGFCCSVM